MKLQTSAGRINNHKLFVMGALLLACGLGWSHGEDAHAIASAMKTQFDRPDAPLQVTPVTVVDDFAVAGWQQTDKGGRALLQKTHGKWVLSVCAGDGLKDAKVLESTGMPAATAQKLSKAVVAAESKLGAQALKRFASFDGFVKIDPAAPSAHGGHGGHGGGHAMPATGHGPAPAVGH